MKIIKIQTNSPDHLELFGELPNNLYGRFALRIYQSPVGWHVAFPKEMVSPLCPLLESDLF